MESEIKEYIINNFKDDDEETIKNAITESIKDQDEVALPGLGVFFILNWNASTAEERSKIVQNIHAQIKQK